MASTPASRASSSKKRSHDAFAEDSPSDDQIRKLQKEADEGQQAARMLRMILPKLSPDMRQQMILEGIATHAAVVEAIGKAYEQITGEEPIYEDPPEASEVVHTVTKNWSGSQGEDAPAEDHADGSYKENPESPSSEDNEQAGPGPEVGSEEETIKVKERVSNHIGERSKEADVISISDEEDASQSTPRSIPNPDPKRTNTTRWERPQPTVRDESGSHNPAVKPSQPSPEPQLVLDFNTAVESAYTIVKRLPKRPKRKSPYHGVVDPEVKSGLIAIINEQIMKYFRYGDAGTVQEPDFRTKVNALHAMGRISLTFLDALHVDRTFRTVRCVVAKIYEAMRYVLRTMSDDERVVVDEELLPAIQTLDWAAHNLKRNLRVEKFSYDDLEVLKEMVSGREQESSTFDRHLRDVKLYIYYMEKHTDASSTIYIRTTELYCAINSIARCTKFRNSFGTMIAPCEL